MVNWAVIFPAASSTHTACSADAQSIPGEELRLGQCKRHLVSSRWQRRPGGEAGSRAVTNRRSAARLPVAGLRPRESQGRRCHCGHSLATDQGRLPGPRRVPTSSTLAMPMRKRVP